MAMQTWREASVEDALSEREQQHTIERIVHRRSELSREPLITCQLQVQGEQSPRSVESLCESISRVYIGMSAQIMRGGMEGVGHYSMVQHVCL